MFLSNIQGTFQDLERVGNSSNTVNATIYNITGPLVSVEVQDQGAGYQLGDSVTFTSPVALTDAEGNVTDTDDRSAIRINLATNKNLNGEFSTGTKPPFFLGA